MLKHLSSVKLTLSLLLLLAGLAVFGTFSPLEAQRYELYYQSFWFRLLLALLAVNLICCTLRSLPGKWNYAEQLFKTFPAQVPADGAILALSVEELQQRLREQGYRLVRDEQRLVAHKNWGRWGAPLVHLAVLLIMLGGVIGESGFVGTINTYLQQPNQVYFDWDAQDNRPLGFSFRVDDFRLRYYPIQLRFELIDIVSGTHHGQLLLFDNDSFAVPETEFSVQLRGFDPEQRLLTMDVYQREQLLGQYLVGDGFEKFGSVQNPSFRLFNVEFRDPVLKQTEAEVSILEDGKLVTQGLIRVNEPLTYRGVSFYQTAYGRDEAGNRSVGFQLSKDPGEWLVWPATILLVAGLLSAFLLPRRALGGLEKEGRLLLFPLAGWQGEAGQEQFEKLLQRVGE
jgi:cytochrome c biogenesis protein